MELYFKKNLITIQKIILFLQANPGHVKNEQYYQNSVIDNGNECYSLFIIIINKPWTVIFLWMNEWFERDWMIANNIYSLWRSLARNHQEWTENIVHNFSGLI